MVKINQRYRRQDSYDRGSREVIVLRATPYEIEYKVLAVFPYAEVSIGSVLSLGRSSFLTKFKLIEGNGNYIAYNYKNKRKV